eukprot:5661-Heterococcus_DN1.PRE.5
MHVCTDNVKLCFDSAGKADKACTGLAGTTCVNGACVCKSGYTLTTPEVYVGNSAAATVVQRTCVQRNTCCPQWCLSARHFTPEKVVCNTGIHVKANRVCMQTSIFNLSVGASAYISRLSCVDTRVFGPGFDPSLLSDKHASKSCIDGRCRCLKGQTLIPARDDVAQIAMDAYCTAPNDDEICAVYVIDVLTMYVLCCMTRCSTMSPRTQFQLAQIHAVSTTGMIWSATTVQCVPQSAKLAGNCTLRYVHNDTTETMYCRVLCAHISMFMASAMPSASYNHRRLTALHMCVCVRVTGASEFRAVMLQFQSDAGIHSEHLQQQRVYRVPSYWLDDCSHCAALIKEHVTDRAGDTSVGVVLQTKQNVQM